MTVHRRLVLFTSLAGCMAALSAGCASPETRVRDIDPQAEPILKRMCATLDHAKAVRFSVSATMDRRVETGQLAQFHRSSEITIARPDRMCAQVESDDGKWAVWYCGKTLTIFDRDSNIYATDAVPGKMGAMLDYMVDEYDVVMPMADLLAGETYNSLMENVESGSYVGLHAVGSTPCHHLLFRQANIEWQIWIDSVNQPLPRKMLITYTEEPDQPQYVATIDGWDLSPKPSADLFTFTPPAGADRVSMKDLVSQEEGQ